MPAIPERQALRQVVVDSLCLRDNPLGDPHVRRCPVYVPPQYDTEPERRFPVVWLLAGYAGWGEQKATAWRAWEEPLPDQLDRLMRAGDLEPAVVAFPDCFTRFGGSQYRNSVGTGRYGDYLADELVSAVDARFAGYLIRARTVPSKFSPLFLYHFTKTTAYETWKNLIFTQATIQNISAVKYSYLAIPLPPLLEQRAICDFVERKNADFRQLSTQIERQIGTLTAYRKSLIHECVTGQRRISETEVQRAINALPTGRPSQ